MHDNPAEVPMHFEQLVKSTVDSNATDVICNFKSCTSIASEQNLPSLPCKCAMPKNTSKWNLKKPGSNITAKLLEFCLVAFPISSVQCESIARRIMVIGTNILREHDAASSKGKKHASLTACKNASSHRMHYEDCIRDIARLFLLCFESNDNHLTPPQVSVNRRNTLLTVKRKLEWSVKKTGSTP